MSTAKSQALWLPRNQFLGPHGAKLRERITWDRRMTRMLPGLKFRLLNIFTVILSCERVRFCILCEFRGTRRMCRILPASLLPGRIVCMK